MKKQMIIVGGGDSYSKREDFLQALRTQPVRDVPSDTPYTSWKQWLTEELGNTWWVDTPQMPNKQNAQYDEWKIWFERHLTMVEGELVLIGYSLGAMFLAKYLTEESTKPDIVALFLLAGPCGSYDDGYGNDCGTFQFTVADLAILSQRVSNIYIMHSQDDPVVPYEHAQQYKNAIPEAELVTFTDKHHFLITEFPELLERIKKI